MSLYQNTKNGQIVEFVGYHDKDFAMIKNQNGSVAYVPLADLVSYEPGKGRTGDVPEPQTAEPEKDENKIPESAIPADTRLNLNVATAEGIAKSIKGIGYATAKKIVELCMSLPGERFKNLDQLRKVGRVDWDQIIAEDLIYIG